MEFIGSFLSLVVSGIFGGLTVKYIDYFFKNSNDRLENLGEAYLLASRLSSFSNQMVLLVGMFIFCEKNNISKDVLTQIKPIENPLPALSFLLNFHLDAPKEVSSQLPTLENMLVSMTKPMAGPLIKNSSTEGAYAEAIKQGLEATKLSVEVQRDLQEWIIEEKRIAQRRIDFIALIRLWGHSVKREIRARLQKEAE